MATLEGAKKKLDIVIRKSRVHWYKPIQIAEILYQHRTGARFDLKNVQAYRNPSKRWRNEMSERLVGRTCTSSARFQDNVFDDNAMPPDCLSLLGLENEAGAQPGMVEAYVYSCYATRLSPLAALADRLNSATVSSFRLSEFVDEFVRSPGLSRSVDKAYEIVVYALFETLVRHLEATVTVSIPPSKQKILVDFEEFTRVVLGLTVKNSSITKPAHLHRVGVTNAADRGLDMWADFGPAIQVKHVSLDEGQAGQIVDQVSEEAKVVIVCDTAHATVIKAVLTQAGFAGRVQGVVTRSDLERWYAKCFEAKYANTIGEELLDNLRHEFSIEFPSSGGALQELQRERGYDRIVLGGIWRVG